MTARGVERTSGSVRAWLGAADAIWGALTGPPRRFCPNRSQMAPRSSAVLGREERHALLPPAPAVFHQSPADIPVCQLPGAGQVSHPETHIRLRLSQAYRFTLVAQQSCGARPDLHQPNLAQAAHRLGIVAALHLSHSISESRRQSTLLSFAGDQREITAARGRVGLGYPNQPFDWWRERQGRKRLCS